jgi:hypothetical protein
MPLTLLILFFNWHTRRLFGISSARFVLLILFGIFTVIFVFLVLFAVVWGMLFLLLGRWPFIPRRRVGRTKHVSRRPSRLGHHIFALVEHLQQHSEESDDQPSNGEYENSTWNRFSTSGCRKDIFLRDLLIPMLSMDMPSWLLSPSHAVLKVWFQCLAVNSSKYRSRLRPRILPIRNKFIKDDRWPKRNI